MPSTSVAHCTQCGHKLSADATFCTACGFKAQPKATTRLVPCLVCGKKNRLLVAALNANCGACRAPLAVGRAVLPEPAPAPGHRTAVCNWCLKKKDIPIASKESQCSECAEAFPADDEEEEEVEDSTPPHVEILQSGVAPPRSAPNPWRDWAIASVVIFSALFAYQFITADFTSNGRFVVTQVCVEEMEVPPSSGSATPWASSSECAKYSPRRTAVPVWLQGVIQRELGVGLVLGGMFVLWRHQKL